MLLREESESGSRPKLLFTTYLLRDPSMQIFDQFSHEAPLSRRSNNNYKMMATWEMHIESSSVK
jgi:hypothetical protein